MFPALAKPQVTSRTRTEVSKDFAGASMKGLLEPRYGWCQANAEHADSWFGFRAHLAGCRVGPPIHAVSALPRDQQPADQLPSLPQIRPPPTAALMHRTIHYNSPRRQLGPVSYPAPPKHLTPHTHPLFVYSAHDRYKTPHHPDALPTDEAFRVLCRDVAEQQYAQRVAPKPVWLHGKAYAMAADDEDASDDYVSTRLRPPRRAHAVRQDSHDTAMARLPSCECLARKVGSATCVCRWLNTDSRAPEA